MCSNIYGRAILLAPPSGQPLEQEPIGIHKDQGWFTIFEIQPSPTTKARSRLLLCRRPVLRNPGARPEPELLQLLVGKSPEDFRRSWLASGSLPRRFRSCPSHPPASFVSSVRLPPALAGGRSKACAVRETHRPEKRLICRNHSSSRATMRLRGRESLKLIAGVNKRQSFAEIARRDLGSLLANFVYRSQRTSHQ